MMSLSSSQPHNKATGPLGTCPACFRSDIRLTVGGVLYSHGPRGAECTGSGKIPLSSASFSQCASITDCITAPTITPSIPSQTTDISNPSSTPEVKFGFLSHIFSLPFPPSNSFQISQTSLCYNTQQDLHINYFQPE